MMPRRSPNDNRARGSRNRRRQQPNAGPRSPSILQRLVQWLRGLSSGGLLGGPAARNGPRPQRQQTRFAAYLSRQSILSFDVDLGEIATPGDLHAALVRRGLRARESTWSFYLPPGPRLTECFPPLAELYPAGAGLKLLKDLNHPDDAIYASHDFGMADSASFSGMTPSPKALVRVANVLHAAGLGPRVHDVVHLRSHGADLTAYVVQHVDGPRADAAAHAAFMQRLKPILSGNLIGTVRTGAASATDFAPPDCNGDLRIDSATGNPLYVDFQTFTIPDEGKLLATIAEAERRHAQPDAASRRRGRAFYQSVPGLVAGERDVEVRWSGLLELLRAGNVALEGRVVYDVGCNVGLMLYQALSDGALWGFGWDLPDVTRAADQVLAALGATRYTLTADAVDGQSDLLSAVPEHFRGRRGGLLFYLSVSEQIGFPESVASLPWTYMIYEGQDTRDIGEQYRHLKEVPWLAKAELLAHRVIADGDAPARTVLLLKRPVP